ncbi:hypothetical protein [Lactiplantibacillus fabifermentans]|uniref:Uncharacterized protein n=2 Tax=Lactiplantibacillus fabifermentans TaxID=483011 RepID=A0A0R2NTS8_9LACO|nr:hypothetical protein [Lactiplantibacillus fabifermentans]ETY72895.1 hypothetical protein LFAB_14820 [Lactiplantibacillus fabifermentans T30PCM01]KRO29094.1 hypothetical protein DY78_GL001503 [Lactiplantibacillus fabifermentans DSM 21115]
MTETTALQTTAEQEIEQAYAHFKERQLALSKADIYAHAAQIFTIDEIVAATKMYLFDETIAQRVVELGSTVLDQMYAQATQTEFLKINFTGNDIRWLLGLPRTHRRH